MELDGVMSKVYRSLKNKTNHHLSGWSEDKPQFKKEILKALNDILDRPDTGNIALMRINRNGKIITGCYSIHGDRYRVGSAPLLLSLCKFECPIFVTPSYVEKHGGKLKSKSNMGVILSAGSHGIKRIEVTPVENTTLSQAHAINVEIEVEGLENYLRNFGARVSARENRRAILKETEDIKSISEYLSFFADFAVLNNDKTYWGDLTMEQEKYASLLTRYFTTFLLSVELGIDFVNGDWRDFPPLAQWTRGMSSDKRDNILLEAYAQACDNIIYLFKGIDIDSLIPERVKKEARELASKVKLPKLERKRAKIKKKTKKATAKKTSKRQTATKSSTREKTVKPKVTDDEDEIYEPRPDSALAPIIPAIYEDTKEDATEKKEETPTPKARKFPIIKKIDFGEMDRTLRNTGSFRYRDAKNMLDEETLGSTNFLTKKFKPLKITGKYKELIGAPTLPFKMMVYGTAGNGKSTFALQLAGYLATLKLKVLYVSAEEGLSYTLQEKLKRLKVAHSNLSLVAEMPSSLTPYDVVFIDSVNHAGLTPEELRKLPSSISYVYVVQANKKGQYRGSAEILHDVDVSIRVENMVATPEKNRFGGKSSIMVLS